MLLQKIYDIRRLRRSVQLARLALAGFCVVPLSSTLAQRSDSVVTFNEIQYHPANSDSPEWVELHNQMAVRVDVSGWSISSGIDFTFPEDSIMEPGAFWVVASAPGHPSLSEIANVFGPFSGKLDNDGEALVLKGRHGRIMDEFEYRDDVVWPAAADGSGATLAKLYDNSASRWPSSWTWSESVGGTPGHVNFYANALENEVRFESQTRSYSSLSPNRGPERSPLRISEISAAGSPDFFIELENTGTLPIELADFAVNGAQLPAHALAGGAFQSYAAAELGLTPIESEKLFLVSSDGFVADAVSAAPHPKALDAQRGVWQLPKTTTPGEANVFAYDDGIVINEIQYHNRPTYPDPIQGIEFEKNDTEWIELYNRSNDTIDLTGWSIADAIEYEFPQGSALGPGAYLVISNQEFSKSLNNRNDRIQLLDSNGNVADFVHYYDDTPWPKTADGHGSSLELIHPQADNSHPASWAASDESGKSVWQNFSYRALGAEPKGNNNPTVFHEFLMGMLSHGEILIDDLSLVEDPTGDAIQLLQNGDFEGDTIGETPASWRILGNHRESHVVNLPEGGKALRIIASGEMDHGFNLASTTLADSQSIDPTKTYEISFRAKWLSGSPQLNTRLYFNRMSHTHILSQPSFTGTPGQPNTVLLEYAPASISGLRHRPLVPNADEPVEVTATVRAPDGITSVTLHYNPGDEWIGLPMSSDSNGQYTATIPGQTDGTVVQFYMEAHSDSGGKTQHPIGGQESKALYRVGDRINGAVNTPTLRLIMLPADVELMHDPLHAPSEHRIGATVIYNNREVWYDAGIRLRGSPISRRSARLGWNVKFPAERPFRGVHETLAIDGGYSIPIGDGGGWIEVGGGIATNELIYNQIARKAGGVPASHDDIAYIEAPRASDDKPAQLKMARFGEIWKASSFEKGDDGTTFEFETLYHPTNTIDGDPESLKDVYNAFRSVTIKDMGPNKEAYRHNFLIKNHLDRDDYSPVINTAIALSDTDDLGPATDVALDVDSWLRVMAMQALTGTIDTYNSRGVPHNLLLYGRPADGKTMVIPWDVDHAFYEDPFASIYGRGNSEIAAVITLPKNRRAYLGHLLDLCQTGFNPDYIANWISHFNETSSQPKAARYLDWIVTRRQFVLSQIETEQPKQPFQITSNGGRDFSVATPEVTLRGRGWIEVTTVEAEETGQSIDLKWINEYEWEIRIALLIGPNPITLTAFNQQGAVVGSDSIFITNTSKAELPSNKHLVISEIMYHPADPTSAEIAAGFADENLFEYFELQNIGVNPIDLRGVVFTEGIAFAFPDTEEIELARGRTILVVQNKAAFEFRYGTGLPIAGAFLDDTRLSNGGERIRLEDANGLAIQDFSFDDSDPWPEAADGGGYSLTLVQPMANPNPDKAASWTASATVGGSPGTSAVVTFQGDPLADEDGDGMSDLLNFALGGGGPEFVPKLFEEDGEIVLSHFRNLSTPDLNLTLYYSEDLVTWTQEPVIFESERTVGDGNSLLRWKLKEQPARVFFRLQAEVP